MYLTLNTTYSPTITSISPTIAPIATRYCGSPIWIHDTDHEGLRPKCAKTYPTSYCYNTLESCLSKCQQYYDCDVASRYDDRLAGNIYGNWHTYFYNCDFPNISNLDWETQTNWGTGASGAHTYFLTQCVHTPNPSSVPTVAPSAASSSTTIIRYNESNGTRSASVSPSIVTTSIIQYVLSLTAMVPTTTLEKTKKTDGYNIWNGDNGLLYMVMMVLAICIVIAILCLCIILCLCLIYKQKQDVDNDNHAVTILKVPNIESVATMTLMMCDQEQIVEIESVDRTEHKPETKGYIYNMDGDQDVDDIDIVDDLSNHGVGESDIKGAVINADPFYCT